MANSIELVKKYVYKLVSLTDVLESDSATVCQGMNTNEIVIPKIDMTVWQTTAVRRLRRR